MVGSSFEGFDQSVFVTADIAALPMAIRICRTVDRFDPQGMRRSYYRLGRTTSSSRAAILHELLQ